MREMTEEGLEFLKEEEGLRTKAYYDRAPNRRFTSFKHMHTDKLGHLTIGVGHLITGKEFQSGKLNIKGEEVPWRRGITEQQALVLLDQDLDEREAYLDATVPRNLKDYQYDALLSFLFNVGRRNFARSTLLKRVQAGRYKDVPREFRKWIYSGGRPILRRRRENEIAVWNGKL